MAAEGLWVFAWLGSVFGSATREFAWFEFLSATMIGLSPTVRSARLLHITIFYFGSPGRPYFSATN